MKALLNDEQTYYFFIVNKCKLKDLHVIFPKLQKNITTFPATISASVYLI